MEKITFNALKLYSLHESKHSPHTIQQNRQLRKFKRNKRQANKQHMLYEHIYGCAQVGYRIALPPAVD